MPAQISTALSLLLLYRHRLHTDTRRVVFRSHPITNVRLAPAPLNRQTPSASPNFEAFEVVDVMGNAVDVCVASRRRTCEQGARRRSLGWVTRGAGVRAWVRWALAGFRRSAGATDEAFCNNSRRPPLRRVTCATLVSGDSVFAGARGALVTIARVTRAGALYLRVWRCGRVLSPC